MVTERSETEGRETVWERGRMREGEGGRQVI